MMSVCPIPPCYNIVQPPVVVFHWNTTCPGWPCSSKISVAQVCPFPPLCNIPQLVLFPMIIISPVSHIPKCHQSPKSVDIIRRYSLPQLVLFPMVFITPVGAVLPWCSLPQLVLFSHGINCPGWSCSMELVTGRLNVVASVPFDPHWNLVSCWIFMCGWKSCLNSLAVMWFLCGSCHFKNYVCFLLYFDT